VPGHVGQDRRVLGRGLDVALSDDILDRIDEILPPGNDVGTLDQAYQPPALQNPSLRRRSLTARAAA
jgi:hypothetical protein